VANFFSEAVKRTRTGATLALFYIGSEDKQPKSFSSSGKSLGIAALSAIPAHFADHGVSPGKAAKPNIIEFLDAMAFLM
jgi:hypothetical protein